MTGRGRKSASRQRTAKSVTDKPVAEKAASAAPAKPAPAEAPVMAPSRAAQAPAEQAARVSVRELMQSQTRDTLDALNRNLAEAMTRSNNVFSTAFQQQRERPGANARMDPLGVGEAVNSVWSKLAADPEGLRDAHGELWRRYGEIWQSHATRYFAGPGAPMPEVTPIKDRRFKDPEWQTDPFFSMMRETYLATAGFITDLVERTEGVDADTKRKAAFFIKQAVDAASPSNFLLTNPTILRATLEQSGQNLLRGLDNLGQDLKRGRGYLSISQADPDAFEVGVNIATSPGKVIFRNEIIEIIQYDPATDTVYEAPLLIFPPWINKFYIMDLQPKNSMIRWLVGQGHTVFLASWVNPDASLAERTFEDYMRDGVFAGVEAVTKAANTKKVNTVGYCIGGTLLAATLAYMSAKGDDRIQSATFFASQSDFELAGELKVFTDAHAIQFLDERMEAEGGVLDAQVMADTFNSLRANDLIWNYVVDNYYLGNQPPPFDLLYWNADQTRMPRALHLFYLQRFYQDNAMARGDLTMLGEKIDLKNVKIPIFMQSSREDHIAPFASIYRGARLFGGPVRFVMAGSGHIAGVINPPAANKYQHWLNSELPDTVEEWMAGAVEHPGSWWPAWNGWLAEISGKQVRARKPGDGPLAAIEDAPGSYVRVKSITG
jgi:polyhydroxyalkanoate synthase subunit PhaC